MPEHHYLVPHQLKGVKTDLEYRVRGEDVEDAEDWFVAAKDRLWHASMWVIQTASDAIKFQLTDSHGHLVNRWTHKEDCIMIGRAGGDSQVPVFMDWLIVDAVEYDDYPDSNIETFAIHLRMAPGSAGALAADGHDTTGTLVILRDHDTLAASYHGRNELQSAGTSVGNEEAGNPWLGLTKDQWLALLKFFIGAT